MILVLHFTLYTFIMPDLITHSLVSRLLLCGRLKKYLLFFLIGTILPDVLSRIPNFFIRSCYRCSWFITVLHSPVIVILFILILVLLFPKNRLGIFLSLTFGMFFHFCLDLFQRHLGGGYYWFFPFSFRFWELGLFWPETSLEFIPYLVLATLIVYGVELYGRGRKARKFLISLISNYSK